MSEPTTLKNQLMHMAVQDMEQFLIIVGELGWQGYRIALYKMEGNSLQQCANKYRVSKKTVRCTWNKCKEKGYDGELKRLLGI